MSETTTIAILIDNATNTIESTKETKSNYQEVIYNLFFIRNKK